jgi:hypothetical protein
MRCRATPGPGAGMVVVCAPEEVDRLARERVRSGEGVHPLDPVSAPGRCAERTEDSGS